MPKAKLVTRSATTTSVTADSIPKGAGLTNAELDSNFLNLRDQGWRLRADDSTQHTITADTQVNFSGGTITADANGDIVVSNLGGGSGSTSQSVFTSFQVSDTGATGTDLGNFFRVNSGQVDFNHQGNAFSTGARFSIYGSDAQSSGATDNIPFEVVLTDKATVRINEMKFPETAGSNGQVLSTNGSGTLSWISAPAGSYTNAFSFYEESTAHPMDNSTFTPNFNNGSTQLHRFEGKNSDAITMNRPTNMDTNDTLTLIFLCNAGTVGQSADILFESNTNFICWGSGIGINYGKAEIFKVYYDGTRHYFTREGTTNLTSH